jgi:hypothetical protein
LQFPVQNKLIAIKTLPYKTLFSPSLGFNLWFECKYAWSNSAWPLNSRSKFSEKALKSYATKYVKLNAETQHEATAAYHNVTEHSLTGKSNLKTKCVANESSFPSQHSLLQQEKPGSLCDTHSSQFP